MKPSLRNTLSYCIAFIYIQLGVIKRRQRKLMNEKIIISIYFHKPSKSMFESCLFWLKKHGYTFISVNDIIDIFNGYKVFPKGAVLVTVDDGWYTNKENIISVANALNVPVTLFVTTNPMETGIGYWWSYVNQARKEGIYNKTTEFLKTIPNRERLVILNEIKSKIILERESLTVNEVIEISNLKNITIGSHTVTHPILKMCDNDESLYEISNSKKVLEGLIKKKIESFAYPNGNFSIREINYLKKLGYKIAFSTIPKYITEANILDIYALPRFEILGNCSLAENICRMTGVWYDVKLFKHNK